MNIIELATQRLHELSRTGVEVPIAGSHGARSDQRVGTLPSTSQATLRQLPSRGESHPEQGDHVSDTEIPSRPGCQSESVNLDIERLEETGVLVSTRSRSTMAEEFEYTGDGGFGDPGGSTGTLSACCRQFTSFLS